MMQKDSILNIERFCSNALRLIEIICSNNVIFQTLQNRPKGNAVNRTAHLNFFFLEIGFFSLLNNL